MGSWQKIITSGSMAQLSSLIVDNITPDLEGGSVLTYLTESGKFRFTGSYSVGSNGNTGTSSFATTAISGGSSNAQFYMHDAFVSGNLIISGAIGTSNAVSIGDVTVNVSTSTGSFIFGSGSDDNTLSHEMTGNLAISGTTGITVNVPANTVGFTGTSSFAESSSHSRTSSFAHDAHSSSYAVTSSYALTAENLLGNVSSATTASYAETASFVEGSVISASYAVTASFLEGSVTSASFAVTASHAVNASLPTDPSFTTITSSGNVLIGGGLEVTNGSTFNSGVAINGNLNLSNILDINNNKLKISASNTEVNFISETVNSTLAVDENIFTFGSKRNEEEINTFIEIASILDKSKGLRFRNINSGSVATIESDQNGIITISGSGHEDAGSIVFGGKEIKFKSGSVIRGGRSVIGEFPNNFIQKHPIIIDHPVTIAESFITLGLTSLTGGISCGSIVNTGETTLSGNIIINSVSTGRRTQIISNTGNIITTGSVVALDGFTGNLTGTSSYATSASNAIVASLASSSVNAMNCLFTSSYADSASYALTASFIEGLTNLDSASFATTASFTHNAHSSSYAVNSTTASFSISAYSSSHAINSNTASFVLSSSYADSASFAITTSGTASYANSASFALSAFDSTTASFALSIPDGLGGGGGLWFDGTTYWSSSLQDNGDVTKIGIGRQPVNYSLEVNGTMAATADVIAFMSSDKRLKNNIKPIENPIEKIKQIGGYTFDWNNNQNIYQGNDVGVIAQEIEKVLPSLVQNREDGYKGVKYDKIVSLLIEAIKDQQKQIDELKKLI